MMVATCVESQINHESAGSLTTIPPTKVELSMWRAKELTSSIIYLARDITHVMYFNRNIYASGIDM